MARAYEQKQRAERATETRGRIVAATVALHEQVGPAETTISAIADSARVQRLTVYRHFPDELSLFRACADHWLARNPAPDPAAWAAIEDPLARLRVALADIYAYFRGTQGMVSHLVRDLPESPALQEAAAPFLQYWATVRKTLDVGWRTRGRRRTLQRAAIGHALAFDTWRSLTAEGLTDRDAAEAMAALADGIRPPRAPGPAARARCPRP